MMVWAPKLESPGPYPSEAWPVGILFVPLVNARSSLVQIEVKFVVTLGCNGLHNVTFNITQIQPGVAITQSPVQWSNHWAIIYCCLMAAHACTHTRMCACARTHEHTYTHTHTHLLQKVTEQWVKLSDNLKLHCYDYFCPPQLSPNHIIL